MVDDVVAFDAFELGACWWDRVVECADTIFAIVRKNFMSPRCAEYSIGAGWDIRFAATTLRARVINWMGRGCAFYRRAC
jgi:hypothetical protein